MENKDQRIESLKNQIQKWDHEYYVLGRPSVSDSEYDRVFEELKTLDSSHLTVGSDLSESTHLKEAPHLVPLLSLDKVYNLSELQKWIDKTGAKKFSIEPKIDGVSLALVYRNGRFQQALTRGDGTKGLDVTHNIRNIKELPHTISSNDTYAFRGEVFMTHQDFQNQKEHTLYANPRNLASGMLRRLELSKEQAGFLHLFIYQGTRFPKDFDSHEEMWEFLQQNHLPMAPYSQFFEKLDDVLGLVENIQRTRKNLPFDIDGLVVKVDDIELRKNLGETAHHPKWAMAFKFSPPSSLSEVLDITVQVGRTGKITPLAHLRPVIIQGSTVKKATLHNKAMIEALEIGIGDVVSISKRGDIIPAIEGIVEKIGSMWKFPTVCPSCGTYLIAEGANEFCPYNDCPDKIRASLFYFTKTLDMRGFGNALVALLFEQFNVRKPEDIWNTDLTKLNHIEGFGQKKIQSLLSSLEKIPKQTAFGTLLVALGIPEISKNVIALLLDKDYLALEKLQSLSEKELLDIKGLGEKTVKRLLHVFTQDSPIVESLKVLQSRGFSMEEKMPQNITNTTLPLSGTIWVLTGVFEHYKPRDKAAKIIQTLGGNTSSSITRQTTHLLYGKEAGQKLDQAKTHSNIVLVSEQEFLANYVP